MTSLRIVLRLVAALLVAGSVFLIVVTPTATVAKTNLGIKLNIAVQCSSVWAQWTDHAEPARLTVNGNATVTLAEAQASCQTASTKIKRISLTLLVAAVLAVAISIVFLRRSPGRRDRARE